MNELEGFKSTRRPRPVAVRISVKYGALSIGAREVLWDDFKWNLPTNAHEWLISPEKRAFCVRVVEGVLNKRGRSHLYVPKRVMRFCSEMGMPVGKSYYLEGRVCPKEKAIVFTLPDFKEATE